MYPIALQCGIHPWQFWDMTMGEILDIIEATRKNEEREVEKLSTLNAALSHNVGAMVRVAIVSAFDKNAKYPKLSEAFPGLFKDVEVEQDWRIAKERLMDYANYINKKRGDGK